MSVTCKNDNNPTGQSTYRNDVLSLQQCCLDPSDGVQTNCMPGYCPGSSMCEKYMRDNCTTRFTNDINCKAWCAAMGPGQCDAGAVDYCKTRARPQDVDDKRFCGCINSLALTSRPQRILYVSMRTASRWGPTKTPRRMDRSNALICPITCRPIPRLPRGRQRPMPPRGRQRPMTPRHRRISKNLSWL